MLKSRSLARVAGRTLSGRRRLSTTSRPLLATRKDTTTHLLPKPDIYSTNSFGEFIHFPDVIEEQQFKVPSFGGTVWVESPINVKLKPAGTMDYPNLDQSFVRLLSRQNTPTADIKVHVKQEGQKLSVQCSCEDEKRKDFLTDVEVPIVHNVNVRATGDACVDIQDFMESNYIHLRGESGRISAGKIKTENLNIQTESGDVYCHGQMQGNIKITTGESGNIVAEKRFVGPNVELETESGDIRVSSSYSEQAKFSSSRGNMNLRNVHNESYVAIYEQGDLKMQGIDGSTNIFVKKGDLDVQISKIHSESRIHVEEGDVHLKLSDSFPLKVSIEANDVVPDTKFASYGKVEKRRDSEYVHYFGAVEPNKFSPTLVVVAENGTVVLDSQDWAASLGMKLTQPPADVMSPSR